MRYIVNWPKAAFYDARKDKDKIVAKGGRVPDFVDERTLEHLARVGAIVVDDDSQPSAPATAPDGPPAKRDDVATWTAYALSVGLTDDELKGLKKPELIAAALAKAGLEDPNPSDPSGEDHATPSGVTGVPAGAGD